jgi:23S rRNA U2552 (ribose-2'-O)-methylase RlmE/FtsJ
MIKCAVSGSGITDTTDCVLDPKKFTNEPYPPNFIEKNISTILKHSASLVINKTKYKLPALRYYELIEKSKTNHINMQPFYGLGFDVINVAKKASVTIAKSASKVLTGKVNDDFSNAFIKLFEIYKTYNIIDSEPIKAFHMCEAPGQWIKTTKYYIDINKKGLEYDWIANSLNPTHPINIEKFGDKIISDDYDFIKNNPDKWLYGTPIDDYPQGTGDITVSANIRWYRDNVKNINLVTGDAGLPTKKSELVQMQKLDFAQMIIVLATLSEGGNCVVKCFLPFINDKEESIEALECYVNLLHTYSVYFDKVNLFKPMSSNPKSGEFYIIGTGFKGIIDEDLSQLLLILDNFNENQIYIEKSTIKNIDIIITFICDLLEYNVIMKDYMLKIFKSLKKYNKYSPFNSKELIDYSNYVCTKWLKDKGLIGKINIV